MFFLDKIFVFQDVILWVKSMEFRDSDDCMGRDEEEEELEVNVSAGD